MVLFDVYIYTIIFILGTVIGSFLNVCIYRIPEKLSIVKPRSRCGNCGTTLKSMDLIPILSWLFLKGKCRYCGAKVSVRYLLVELLEGVLFVLVYTFFGYSWMTPIMWCFFAYLTVVLFIDLDHRIIPNKLVLFGCVIGFMPVVYHYLDAYPLYYSHNLLEPLVSMLVPPALMLLMSFLSLILFRKNGMGMGDVKIYLPIGLFLGWQLALMSIWFSFFLGGLFGLVWIFILRKSKTDMIPFAPFIVIGTIVSVLIGKSIYVWLLTT